MLGKVFFFGYSNLKHKFFETLDHLLLEVLEIV